MAEGKRLRMMRPSFTYSTGTLTPGIFASTKRCGVILLSISQS